MSFNIEIILVFLSFLASLTTYFRKGTRLFLKIFPFFLFVTLIVEIVGQYLSDHKRNNTLLYNFFGVFEFTFYFWILRLIIRNAVAKKIIFHLLWIYPIISLVNIFFIQKLNIFGTITYSLGCLFIVVITIYYFFELFQLPPAIPLLREPAFWICSGLLLYYCCSFPMFALMTHLGKNTPRFITKNLDNILNLLNILLYSSFTIAFLCRPRVRKSTLKFL
jgi:hypothetical protein